MLKLEYNQIEMHTKYDKNKIKKDMWLSSQSSSLNHA